MARLLAESGTQDAAGTHPPLAVRLRYAERLRHRLATGPACRSCGAPVPAEARFCRRCGSSVAITCTQCRTMLPAGAQFCRCCGARVSGDAPHVPGAAHRGAPMAIDLLDDVQELSSRVTGLFYATLRHDGRPNGDGACRRR